jgi:hypothetical protein
MVKRVPALKARQQLGTLREWEGIAIVSRQFVRALG